MGDMMLNARDRSLGLDACRSHNIRMHISSKNKSYFLLTRQSVDLLIVAPTRLRRCKIANMRTMKKNMIVRITNRVF